MSQSASSDESSVSDVVPKGETAEPSTGRPRHPLMDLLGRYRAVLRASWDVRHQLAGPARLADEAAFLPAALSLQETPVHPSPRRLAWTLIVLFLIALAWSILGKVDIVAVAPGRIIVSERTKVIQTLETSVVQRVLVRDGDRVKAGQVLVELDPTMVTADRANAKERLAFARSESMRSEALLKSLATGKTPRVTPRPEDSEGWELVQSQLAAEWQDLRAKEAQFEAQIQRRQAEIVTVRETISKLEATLPLLKAREEDFKRLVERGFTSGHATQDKTRERLELELDVALQRSRLIEAQSALAETRQSAASWRAETRNTLQRRLAEAQTSALQLVHDQAKAVQKEKLTHLRAPVDGVVQQLAVHTAGGVATEAQPLMVIVPDDAEVIAEVTLENRDIGFVYEGQGASIKLETFLYTRYGTVPARVKWVTPDAVNDEKRGAIFPVTLTLDRVAIDVDGKQMRLTPGMSLTAEIKTGQRRVIEYLLSPIERASTESLRER